MSKYCDIDKTRCIKGVERSVRIVRYGLIHCCVKDTLRFDKAKRINT